MFEKQLASFFKTKAFLSKMELNAAGWDANIVDEKLASEPAVMVYVYDLPTKWSWMASVPLDVFSQLSQRGYSEKAIVKPVREHLSLVMSRVADKTPPEPIDGLSWEGQLAALMCLYAGSTQSWQLAKGLGTGGHFIVLNYRRRGVAEGLLRPFAIGPEKRVLPAAEFEAAVDHVIMGDRMRHPDWFPKDKVAR